MIWTAQRSKNWPDVPTMQELGYPFVFDSPFGIAGPKGMDPKVVAKLHSAFKKATEEPALLESKKSPPSAPAPDSRLPIKSTERWRSRMSRKFVAPSALPPVFTISPTLRRYLGLRGRAFIVRLQASR
jgi:hypothetical protein